MLALRSLSWNEPHAGQVHFRTDRLITALFLCPQEEHSWLEAKCLATGTTCFPYQLSLYSSIVLNMLQETSEITLERFAFLSRLPILKSSIFIWFTGAHAADTVQGGPSGPADQFFDALMLREKDAVDKEFILFDESSAGCIPWYGKLEKHAF